MPFTNSLGRRIGRAALISLVACILLALVGGAAFGAAGKRKPRHHHAHHHKRKHAKHKRRHHRHPARHRKHAKHKSKHPKHHRKHHRRKHHRRKHHHRKHVAAPQPPAGIGRMVVGLNGGSYGMGGVADVRNAVGYVRLDSLLGATSLRNYENGGVKVDLDFSGPYTRGGVSALNAGAWVASTLAFYRANTDPSRTPFIEVLNEPGGTWFWGSNAISQQNADAYRNLVHLTWSAFHAVYGDRAPKILATFDGSQAMTFGVRWWRPESAAYVDGIVVHPYGGTGDRFTSALGNRQRVVDAHNYTHKPIYVTEVGWPTCTACSATSDSRQWSEVDQANNLTSFMNWARSTGFVAAVMYFNYRDFGGSNWYGVVRGNGTHKPAYYALHAEAMK
jgi:putative glycosyl hydrolase